jgi:hypothetical protein
MTARPTAGMLRALDAALPRLVGRGEPLVLEVVIEPHGIAGMTVEERVRRHPI